MLDRLTLAQLEDAKTRAERQAPRPRVWLVHPDDKKHLDEHGGGRAGCFTCMAIIARAMPASG